MTFGLVLAAAVLSWMILAFRMRGIVWDHPNSDAAKQIRAASNISSWRWPSDMHSFADNKARMKDIGVLMLVVMQRLLRDRITYYPLAAGCALVNSITGMLIFLVSSSYWDSSVGLLLFILYMGCFWPYMIVLQGGFQALALLFLLLSVYFLELTMTLGTSFSVPLYAASGAAFGAMMFSSASSGKLIPLYIGALIFSQRGIFDGPESFGPASSIDWAILSTAVSLCVVLLFLALAFGLNRHMKHSRIRLLMISHVNNGLNMRLKELRKFYWTVNGIFKTGAALALLSTILCVLLSSLLVHSTELSIALPSVIVGVSAVGIILLYPNITRNIRGYQLYWNVSKIGAHYRLYDDYFKQRIGKTVTDGAGGIRWYLRYHSRMVPFHTAFYAVAVLFLVYRGSVDGLSSGGVTVLAIILLSASPIIWSEATKAPKTALPYFPIMVGLLLAIGHASFLAEQSLFSEHPVLFQAAALLAALVASIWNIWMLIYDVWPARMGTAQLARTLKDLNITRFYTYDTQFNDGFVGGLPVDDRDRYEIQHISNLRDARHGYLVIPPTSSKAATLESSTVGRTGDFNDDPLLIELINSKQISKYAVASFKTHASSRVWGQTSAIVSYRDLILGEVNDHDRRRGLGWIVDAERLHADQAKRADQTQVHQ